ncbi:ABC transporter permease [Fervidibacillus halotolerans]|uniref:ABC transporter permease n=1 Tax=Fervidibacillus halotolerans TaxID=2980027 RepID=A0A9E8RXV2_9BACI|nr:ABC transporter permease [Fervidibacillus halotolerans]WAA13140.1 ABC transporter permease [Fervidibacillus halotolerans]
MIAILQTKFRLLLKKPLMFIGMTGMGLLFAFFLGMGQYSKMMVPVFSNIENLEKTEIWEQLQESESIAFYIVSEKEAKRAVSEGKVEAAVSLSEDSYEIFVVSGTPNVQFIQHYIHSIYSDILLKENIRKEWKNDEDGAEALINQLEQVRENPLFQIQTGTFQMENSFVYDNRLQSLFGMSLFFVIYTIAFNVVHILQEKTEKVWDRMILSPLRKWEMYTGNLLYSFLIGYVQVVLIFTVFKYLTGVNFYGGFGKTLLLLIPYVFAIIALSMFIVSVVKNIQQYNAIIPFISVSMAMLGGAYWPLEIVSSPILLTLSKFVPITYGMESLKGATVYGASLNELIEPVSILILMGVLFISLGIGLIERRSE